MDRRDFIQSTAVVAAALTLGVRPAAAERPAEEEGAYTEFVRRHIGDRRAGCALHDGFAPDSITLPPEIRVARS